MGWLHSIGEAIGLLERPRTRGDGFPSFGDSATTVPISVEEARKNATVTAVCRTVARLVSQIPLDSPSPRIRRILARPNTHQSPQEFRHSVQYAISLFGNGYVRAIRASSGRIVAIAPLDSELVHVGYDDFGAPLYWDTFQGSKRIFDTRDVCHLRDGGTHELVTPSRLEAAGSRVRLLIEADTLISSAFTHSIAAQYTLESDDPISSKREKAILARLHELFGRDGKRRNGVVITGNSRLKRVPGITVADADLRALRSDLQSEIASLYDLPPFQISGEATARYSNHTAQNIALLRDVVAPAATNLAEKLGTFLEGEITPRLEAFIVGDWQLLGNTMNTLAGGPVLSVDEARSRFLQMPGIPGGAELRARRDGLAPEGAGDREGEEPSDDGSTVIGNES